MLNMSGESGHPCLIADCRGRKLSNFHYWVWCKLWACHIWTLLCWDMFFICYDLLFLIINVCGFLLIGFFCIFWDDHMTLLLLMWYITFCMLNHSFISGWIPVDYGVISLLHALKFGLQVFCEIFASIFIKRYLAIDLLFCSFFVLVLIWGTCFYHKIVQGTLFFDILHSLKRMVFNSSLNVLVNSPVKPSAPRLFFMGDF